MITIRRGLRRQHGVQLAHLPRPDHHRRQPRRDRLRRLQERGHSECLRLLPSELCEYILVLPQWTICMNMNVLWKKSIFQNLFPFIPQSYQNVRDRIKCAFFQLRPFIGQNGALACTGLTKYISMHPTITLCGRGRSIFSEVAEQSFTFLRGGQKTEVCKCFMYSAAFSISCSKVIFNPIITGGGHICPPHHVFAYTRVCMRIRVLIFCDFSSFWVWKRIQQVWP